MDFGSVSEHFCRCSTGYLEDPATGTCTIEQCSGGDHFCMNGQSCNGPSSCTCSAPYSGDNCQDGTYGLVTENSIVSNYEPFRLL